MNIINDINNNKYESLDKDYEKLVKNVEERFYNISENNNLFKVKTKNKLYDLFLAYLPEEIRQQYNCHTCAHFVNNYGRVVIIDNDNKVVSALWNVDETPEVFKDSVSAMVREINRGIIENEFITNNIVLGDKERGGFIHFHAIYKENSNIHTSTKRIVSRLSENLENYKMLNNAINEYDLSIVSQARILLESSSLYRAYLCVGTAKAFEKLLQDLDNTMNELEKDRIIWKYISVNPNGNCHIKSSMIGTLLDDIKDGYDFDSIARRFADKMDPLHYMRPKAEPKADNVKRAEELIKELNLANSLKRRFAYKEDLNYVWKSKQTNEVAKEDDGSVFGYLLKDKDKKAAISADLNIPEQKITVSKFMKDVLPMADKVLVDIDKYSNNRITFVTAEDPESNPIIKWDKPDNRYPISSFCYTSSTHVSDWGIESGYNEAYGITLLDNRHIFIIENMHNNLYKEGTGCGLFPEILIPELREVRSTIEAYSDTNDLHGDKERSACGVSLLNAHVIVETNGVNLKYYIDRLE